MYDDFALEKPRELYTHPWRYFQRPCDAKRSIGTRWFVRVPGSSSNDARWTITRASVRRRCVLKSETRQFSTVFSDPSLDGTRTNRSNRRFADSPFRRFARKTYCLYAPARPWRDANYLTITPRVVPRGKRHENTISLNRRANARVNIGPARDWCTRVNSIIPERNKVRSHFCSRENYTGARHSTPRARRRNLNRAAGNPEKRCNVFATFLVRARLISIYRTKRF